jgi:SagB-type dehydrogenase family enzyme
VTTRVALTERLALRPGVSAATAPDGEVTLIVANRGERIGRLRPDEHAALRRLAAGPCPETELDAGELVARLRRGGWLSQTWEYAGRPMMTVRPLVAQGTVRRPDSWTSATLSRFAVLRADGGGLVLESPLATVAVHLHDPAVIALLYGTTDLPDEVGYELTAALIGYGFLLADPGAEDRELATSQWSHHDLWFHARSRYGRHDGRAGATYWAKGRFEPPSRPPPTPGTGIELYRPDLTEVNAADPPLTAVLEARRTVREHDTVNPLTVKELGEFLYRCARVRGAGHNGGQEIFDRPYPSGGRLHPLELYPVVTNVTGLRPGMYHYDPVRHRLDPVPAPEHPVRRLVRQAQVSAAAPVPPQVLILIAARFGAPMWKYEGIGYALVLKEVGVLLQTMYLVATAMGLAPCALGTGDTELFAAATGLPYLTESTVGELMLGRVSPPGNSATPG